MCRQQITSKESVSPQKGSNFDLNLSPVTYVLLLSCSLLPHRQYRGDYGGSDLCRHPGLHHSLHQESPDHRAAPRLPDGLLGLPDRRALLPVRHPVVSPSSINQNYQCTTDGAGSGSKVSQICILSDHQQMATSLVAKTKTFPSIFCINSGLILSFTACLTLSFCHISA